MSDIENGDIVYAPDYFGEKSLTFVGMRKTGDYNNNCVVIKDGKAIPIIFKYLTKLDPK